MRVRVRYEGDLLQLADLIWDETERYVNEVSQGYKYKRSPGLALIDEAFLGQWASRLYESAVTEVVLPEVARKLAAKHGAILRGGRGVIGALASMGFTSPYTYELIFYRRMEKWGTTRVIDEDQIRQLDSFFPLLFYNYDYVKRKPLVQSRGNDPVLMGIRGLSFELLNWIPSVINLHEEIDGYLIYKTNQHSDHHLLKPSSKPYGTIMEECEVNGISSLKGGDVLLNCSGRSVVAFKETRELNRAVSELRPGDRIIIVGAVRPSSRLSKIVELERMVVVELKSELLYENPTCPLCGASTESLGSRGGYRCRKCHHRFNGVRRAIEVHRGLSLGTYQAPLYRHLTRPLFLPGLSNGNLDG
nr:DUF1743 domain-containing protein [Sulfodiicoccus acidiphilus]